MQSNKQTSTKLLTFSSSYLSQVHCCWYPCLILPGHWARFYSQPNTSDTVPCMQTVSVALEHEQGAEKGKAGKDSRHFQSQKLCDLPFPKCATHKFPSGEANNAWVDYLNSTTGEGQRTENASRETRLHVIPPAWAAGNILELLAYRTWGTEPTGPDLAAATC